MWISSGESILLQAQIILYNNSKSTNNSNIKEVKRFKIIVINIFKKMEKITENKT